MEHEYATIYMALRYLRVHKTRLSDPVATGGGNLNLPTWKCSEARCRRNPRNSTRRLSVCDNLQAYLLSHCIHSLEPEIPAAAERHAGLKQLLVGLLHLP